MIYDVLTKQQFRKAFHDMGRGDQFSPEALNAIYDFYDRDDIHLELDVIGICSLYSEYENIEEVQVDYPDIETIEQLEYETIVLITESGSIVIEAY